MAGERTSEAERFPLADLIQVVGAQLREAEERAASSGARTLQLKECSVQMGIQWDKNAEGEIGIWVVKLGGAVTKQNTELITVTMEPFAEGGRSTARSGAPAGRRRRRPIGR